jgi:hypothetical protein
MQDLRSLWYALGAALTLSCATIDPLSGVTPNATPKPLLPLPAASQEVKAFVLGTCPLHPEKTGKEVEGNPAARKAAEKGLAFLATEAVKWQETNKCYGCHVQAVTLEAMAIGVHHQYALDQQAFKTIVDGMLTLPGGAHSKTGFNYRDQTAGVSDGAKLLGGPALARYDQWVNETLQDDLLNDAQDILKLQKADGSVPTIGWVNFPVYSNTTQGTAHAIQTWKQAYERSADAQWLTAIGKAEDYLQGVVSGFEKTPPGYIQELNFSVIGLLSAGVSPSEEVMLRLTKMIEERQNEDGGWGYIKKGTTPTSGGFGYEKSGNGDSNAFATGQTLYALRLLGMTDQDKLIEKGTSWLLEFQKTDGGWSSAGFGKAEAMWALLGLVSVDVLSVTFTGLQDGQHVSGDELLAVQARDNKGGGVSKVEVFVDDILLYAACGDALHYNWNADSLTPGKHIVVAIATNAKGEMSKRRLEVYAGDVFMTQLGSRYEAGNTVLSMRNIANQKMGTNQVELVIFTTQEKDGVTKASTEVIKQKKDGAQGAMSFNWDGKAADGQVQKAGKYIAALRFLDSAGKVRQTEELVFVNDTPQAQAAAYGEVEGQVVLRGGEAAENTAIDLVDEKGNVVQTTISTQSGQYRFKNVDADKKYSIAVRKNGYEERPAATVEAAAGVGMPADAYAKTPVKAVATKKAEKSKADTIVLDAKK